MATAVFFHAHPDDECVLTGGTMLKLATLGHRVVLVTATRGEEGEIVPGTVPEGTTLAEQRQRELEAAAAVLGVARLEFLEYVDSGMIGTPANKAPGSFWRADVDEAAARLATVLTDEAAAILVVYDDHGGYGHPDHIQVHRVGVRAAELAGTPVVYEATIDRDRLIALIRQAPEREALPDVDTETFGVSGELVTTRVDVTDHTAAKRLAMTCHRSQIGEDSFWLTMPEDGFRLAFGQEEFIRRAAPPGTVESDLDLG